MTYVVRARGQVSVTDVGLRCGRCNKLLAERVTRPWRIRCGRCSHTNVSPRGTPEETDVTPPVQPIDSPELPMLF